jgi:hypothetical protein
VNDDPRSMVGQLARGANIYMGASKSPYAGKTTQNSVSLMKEVPNMRSASMLPQYKRPSLADVARTFLNGNRNQ